MYTKGTFCCKLDSLNLYDIETDDEDSSVHEVIIIILTLSQAIVYLGKFIVLTIFIFLRLIDWPAD